jgi:hypothetical protein
MSIQWRQTLIQLQAVLQTQTSSGSSTFSLSTSTEGYRLVNELLMYGPVYDATADDGATNTGAVAANINSYVAQASPTFLELDRVCRYILTQYLGTSYVTPQMAVDFGCITAAQAATWTTYIEEINVGQAPTVSPPTLGPAIPLAFDRTYSTATASALSARSNDAAILAQLAFPISALLSSAQTAWYSGLWYDTSHASHALTSPPTNPSVPGEAASVLATNNITIVVSDAQTWLAAVSFP